MVKKLKELNESEKTVYNYILKSVNDDGSNLVTVLTEIEEFYSAIDEKVLDAFEVVSEIEMVNIINLVSSKILKKHASNK
ncbi:hypothetical protein [Exiguobacterium sp. s133]|uniref:hypothetical protein n=1 Tax=Exiguobacterium sp. s133 TaxID=2751213 RepID=UPI001BEAE245|nr:hypothetical protein [Exiguobacterium sp. s133]